MDTQSMGSTPRTSRRWLWWIPAGCLLVVLLMIAAAMALVWMIGAAIGSAEAYQEPLRRAQVSTEVRALLGEPIEAGWLPQGQVSVNGNDGKAQLSIPISGPRGSAVIEVQADKQGGEWRYQRIEVMPAEDGTPIDLR